MRAINWLGLVVGSFCVHVTVVACSGDTHDAAAEGAGGTTSSVTSGPSTGSAFPSTGSGGTVCDCPAPPAPTVITKVVCDEHSYARFPFPGRTVQSLIGTRAYARHPFGLGGYREALWVEHVVNLDDGLVEFYCSSSASTPPDEFLIIVP